MTIKLKHIPLLNIDLFYWFHAVFEALQEIDEATLKPDVGANLDDDFPYVQFDYWSIGASFFHRF